MRIFCVLAGIFLMIFGVSLEAVQSEKKKFIPNKHKITKHTHKTKINGHELRKKFKSHMSPSEKKLYNECRKIAKNKDKTVEARIDDLIELSEQKNLNRPKRHMVLNNAVLLAHLEMKDEEREETLKRLEKLAPQSKWFLQNHPSQSLLRNSQAQYDVLTGNEDL